MTERPKVQPDSFFEYRTSKEGEPFVPWKDWRKQISGFYPDTTIPKEIEPHLQEWYVIRARVHTRLIDVAEFNVLQKKFSEEHPDLFDNPANIKAISTISARFPLAV